MCICALYNTVYMRTKGAQLNEKNNMKTTHAIQWNRDDKTVAINISNGTNDGPMLVRATNEVEQTDLFMNNYVKQTPPERDKANTILTGERRIRDDAHHNMVSKGCVRYLNIYVPLSGTYATMIVAGTTNMPPTGNMQHQRDDKQEQQIWRSPHYLVIT